MGKRQDQALYVVNVDVTIPNGHAVAPAGSAGALVMGFVLASTPEDAESKVWAALSEDGYTPRLTEYTSEADALDWAGTADFRLHEEARETARSSGEVAYGKFYAYRDAELH